MCFLPSSVGTCPQRKDGANAPRARSITAHLAVIEKALAYSGSHPRNQAPQKVFRKSTKWWISPQTTGAAKATRVRGCPERCQLGAPKEPAPSSHLILRRMSHGAICSINTPAVINTVLRQPMAWKRLREGGAWSGNGCSSGCPRSPIAAAILCQS